jgi:hypothetical protein
MGGGAPVGAARGTGLSPSGTFVLTNPPPAVILVSRIPGGQAQYTRHALDRPTYRRAAFTTFARLPPRSALRDPLTVVPSSHALRPETTKETGKETVLSQLAF